MSHGYPPVALAPLPPTSNTRSSHQRSILIRTSRKLSKILGDVPRVPDDDDIAATPTGSYSPGPSSHSWLDLARTMTAGSIDHIHSESTWQRRKPTHLPPLLKLAAGGPLTDGVPDHSSPLSSAVTRRGSVLSVAPSIVSNAPSSATTGSSVADATPSATTQRRFKFERLRRRLGDEVPATAVFPTPPHSPSAAATAAPSSSSKKANSRTRARSVTRQKDDARSIAFSINSDESVHQVTFTTRVQPPQTKQQQQQQQQHIYHVGALPPIPSIPVKHRSSTRRGGGSGDGDDNDESGLVRPRVKMPAGSMIGGAEFKAARRAKKEGRALNGMAEPGELVEMVGFMF